MIFEISHRATYSYSAPVLQSYHLLHLTPRARLRQAVLRHSLLIDPAPSSRNDLTDDFGNPASIIAVERDHTELLIHSRSQVDVKDPPAQLSKTGSWNDVAAQLRANLGPETFGAIQYSCPSRSIRPSSELHKFAKPCFPDGRPVIEAAIDLTSRIHREFDYQKDAADAAPSVQDVLRSKRGNHHDLAHIEIACLRTLGLAARYVSGYRLAGTPQATGETGCPEVSHAWLSVWSPETGWVDLDPTYDCMPGAEYITLAFGRDFQDVSPVSGVLLGGGDHEVEVAVEITPVASPQPG